MPFTILSQTSEAESAPLLEDPIVGVAASELNAQPVLGSNPGDRPRRTATLTPFREAVFELVATPCDPAGRASDHPLKVNKGSNHVLRDLSALTGHPAKQPSKRW